MLFKDKKEGALGGNYKLKDIKVFGSKENLYQNVKKYRKVYDLIECRYLYCELSFYNKLFDEFDWETKVKFVCNNVDTGTKVCELEKEIIIPKEQNIIYMREGWGTPDPGWWQKGEYEWEVYIDNQLISKTDFYIVEAGLVSPEDNPYFEIEEIRLFESPRIGQDVKERVYLHNFSAANTRYINVELRLNILLPKEELFPLELQFNFYNDSGQLKGVMSFFKAYVQHSGKITMDSGYGSDKSGYWFGDKYTIEVIFMDQMVAVIPFEVAENDETNDDPISFLTTKDNKRFTPPVLKKISFEEAKAELEGLIGLNTVKAQINELATYMQFLKVRKDKGLEDKQPLNLHSVFTGNPGTGKTTVAKTLGQIYYSLDLLTHGRVLEVGRADLVGEFIGQTAPKVKKIVEKSRGGVLFIDEAYSLTNRGDEGKDFGREVIEVLLKELAENNNDLAIIFAGYPKEMQTFINSNPGLHSRLRNIIHFPDYAPDDLMEIAEYTAQHRGVLINNTAKELIHKKLVEVYRNRDEQFGNARYINGVIEEAKQNLAIRLMKSGKNLNELEPEDLSTIDLEDVEKVFAHGEKDAVSLPVDEALLEDAIAQLRELVGLEDLKKEVDEQTKLVRYYREIGKDVKKAFSLHTVFKGNPGTGKTTVARLLVQIYKALGILERGHLVECDRKTLVAGHVGQTAIKTSEMIDKSIGGGLFIDEAYALTKGDKHDFGNEAIETLLKRMEDQRGEFMVIVAGYPEEMKTFLEANPGLLSRFDKQFNFKDYTADELLDIGKILFEKENLSLEPKAAAHLKFYIEKLLENKHKYFGNARTIRKVVEETIRRQNLRMADIPAAKRTRNLINTIVLGDISGFAIMEEGIEPKRGIGFR
ncbi:MAG: SpoVK/Ycf46/Vps4 family AAA+-type ATPase [Saprospiraceae bacterium]|jgi:SpoVK/Ycf46/Vps4 family AAA+-type ATPase